MARKKKIIRCSCKACTAGLHGGGGFEMEKAIRKLRRRTKNFLKAERYDEALDVVVGCSYMD